MARAAVEGIVIGKFPCTLNGILFFLALIVVIAVDLVQSVHENPHFFLRKSLATRGSHATSLPIRFGYKQQSRHSNPGREEVNVHIGTDTVNHLLQLNRRDKRAIELVASVILRKRKKRKDTKGTSPSPLPYDRYYHIGRASVPEHIWHQLTGDEFFLPKVISSLAKSGIDICSSIRQGPAHWKPTKSTHHVLTSLSIPDDNNSSNDKALLPYLLQHKDAVLVWTGKLKEGFHGCHLPCIKTRAVIPMPPKELAKLLMDSSKVVLYNKMSLGRSDLNILTHGVDSEEGESKIVRNRTKPPLSNGRIMEFHTFMHARKLATLLQEDGDGYIVVSRAVAQSTSNPYHQESGVIPSEIILGANLLRSIQGDDNKTDFTGVTHVNAPNVPLLLAKKVGIKGSVDFINDIRNLCSK
jgi:hypothetical protein